MNVINVHGEKVKIVKTTFLDLFISTDALHVSGGSSAHHQEHITVLQLQVLSTSTAVCCYR